MYSALGSKCYRLILQDHVYDQHTCMETETLVWYFVFVCLFFVFVFFSGG